MKTTSTAEAASVESSAPATEPAAVESATAMETATLEPAATSTMKAATVETSTPAASPMKTTTAVTPAALSEGWIWRECKIRESSDCNEGFNKGAESAYHVLPPSGAAGRSAIDDVPGLCVCAPPRFAGNPNRNVQAECQRSARHHCRLTAMFLIGPAHNNISDKPQLTCSRWPSSTRVVLFGQ
jgi:hypothetical protein